MTGIIGIAARTNHYVYDMHYNGQIPGIQSQDLEPTRTLSFGHAAAL